VSTGHVVWIYWHLPKDNKWNCWKEDIF